MKRKSKKVVDKALQQAYKEYVLANILFSAAKKRKEVAEKTLQIYQKIKNSW